MAQVGFGASATGGTGGTSYVVTSSSNSGSGSLREAMTASGARTVTFSPSVRDIELTSTLAVNSGNLTVDGESAGGVQIRGALVQIKASNVILRHLKIRRGDTSSRGDGLQIANFHTPISKFYLENLDVCFATDENLNVHSHAFDGTIKDCIVAQALFNVSGISGGPGRVFMFNKSSGDLRPERWTVIGNLIGYGRRRCPLIADGHKIEVLNNFIIGSQDADSSFDIWGSNHGSNGDTDDVYSGYNHCQYTEEATEKSQPFMRVENGGPTLYYQGNLLWDENGNPLNFSPPYWGGGTASNTKPSWATDAHQTNVNLVRASVLANAGAFPSNRDSMSQNIITAATAGANGIVDDMADVGGFSPQPTYYADPQEDPTVAGIKTRASLRTLVTTNLASGTGDITAAEHREVVTSLIDSLIAPEETELRVENMTTTEWSGSPAPADREAYVVAATATGDFAGQENNVAIWDGQISIPDWVFISPVVGMIVFDKATRRRFRWDGSAWQPVSVYDMTVAFNSVSDGQVLFRHVAVRALYFPADFAGSRGIQPDGLPAATFNITVRKKLPGSPTSYTTIGTVTISTAGAFTFTTEGSPGDTQTVNEGEELQFVAPSASPSETQISGVSFTMMVSSEEY